MLKTCLAFQYRVGSMQFPRNSHCAVQFKLRIWDKTHISNSNQYSHLKSITFQPESHSHYRFSGQCQWMNEQLITEKKNQQKLYDIYLFRTRYEHAPTRTPKTNIHREKKKSLQMNARTTHNAQCSPFDSPLKAINVFNETSWAPKIPWVLNE